MIVCVCHRVSDRDIQRAVASGVRCFEVLQDESRVASSCGCCHDCAREVFDAATVTWPMRHRSHAAEAVATAES